METTTDDREKTAQKDIIRPAVTPAESKDGETISDEDYWEQMMFISRGPAGWNIGCGCG